MEKQSEHKPGAAFVREHGARLRRAAESQRVRHAWTGVVALAVTGGVLVSASASAATSGTAAPETTASGTTSSRPVADAGRSPARPGGQGNEAGVPTALEGVTVGQVLAVLDRAERTLRQHSSPSPRVAQAAAELGMLYTTYEAQQLALAAAAEPLRVETAPVAGRARPAASGDVPSAAPVSRVVSEKQGVAQEPVKIQEPHHDAHPRATQQAPGYVTFDEVAVAAMRLANMLDPSSPSALVETLPRAESSLRRSLLETVAAYGESTAGYANGRIPADVLCPLEFAPGHMLRCDAAERLAALSDEFEKEFGYPIPLTDSYRPFAMQVAVKGTKPHLAAIPGTSNHGWGLAIDLGDPIAGGSSPEYVWLRLHAPDYGWDNPSWAQLGGAKPEPWHFEFFAAGSIPNRAIDPADVGAWAPAPSTDPAGSSPVLPASARGPADTGRADARPADNRGPAGTSDAADRGASNAGGAADRPGDDSPPKPSDQAPTTPTQPTPEEPAPSEPPASEEPDAPADTGLVEDVVGGTVGVVGGVVDGVVGGLLGPGSGQQR
ncbi:D-alanyl-D-alanine carboxypeptidase family protein [Promicromonospora vindobonensis]|uniref:D-alanyl-D-alanine carboxypeptidase family protein n=1 Tax=Promicromonospora vindobonensis TaxID=195748 RepID=A0ABW5W230_9MICO